MSILAGLRFCSQFASGFFQKQRLPGRSLELVEIEYEIIIKHMIPVDLLKQESSIRTSTRNRVCFL
jgi:hypothetical protein